MKLIFINVTASIFILFYSCSSNSENNKTVLNKIKATNIILNAQYDSSNVKDSIRYLFIKTTLVNKTAVTVTYQTMACDWARPFTTDAKDLKVHHDLCFSDMMITDSIASFGSKDYNLILTTNKGTPKDKTKIGFNLIEKIMAKDNFSLSDSLDNMKHVIWSNSIVEF